MAAKNVQAHSQNGNRRIKVALQAPLPSGRGVPGKAAVAGVMVAAEAVAEAEEGAEAA
eukprot:SAG11_NODE_3836_length_2196_cov_1.024797_1_plen_57_part_10